MAFIKTAGCKTCGTIKRNDEFALGQVVRCEKCDGKVAVGYTLHPYGTLFAKGEALKVFAPQTLGYPPSSNYPLRRLHENKIIVVVLEEGPDEQGTVLCRLPFRFKPEGAEHETDVMPILYSVLERA